MLTSIKKFFFFCGTDGFDCNQRNGAIHQGLVIKVSFIILKVCANNFV